VLRLARGRRSLQMSRVVRLVSILFHLTLRDILRVPVVSHVLVHVLVNWLCTVLFVKILQVHAVHGLARGAARHLQLVHLDWMHLRVVGVEGPREVAYHLLADVARRLSMGLRGILGHHDVLIRSIVRRRSPAQVNGVIRLLSRRALVQIATQVKLLLGA